MLWHGTVLPPSAIPPKDAFVVAVEREPPPDPDKEKAGKSGQPRQSVEMLSAQLYSLVTPEVLIYFRLFEVDFSSSLVAAGAVAGIRVPTEPLHQGAALVPVSAVR